MAYRDACDAVEKITAPETKTAVATVLRLLHELNTRVLELQDVDDDE